VPTAQARAVLPRAILLNTVVRQTASVAQMVMAIHRGDIEMMGYLLERDYIVEPARRELMPGLQDVRGAAKQVGALGTAISGAGPTLVSICPSTNVARMVNEAALSVYALMGIEADAQVSQPSLDGVTYRILEKE
jgi:homoserine kinase